MRAALHIPPALTRDETQSLLAAYAEAVATGGPESVQDGSVETKLFNGNLRFAWLVAGRFEVAGSALGYDVEDLFAEASVALLDAIRKYDPRVAVDPSGRNSFSGWCSRLMHQRLVAFVKARGNSSPDPMRDVVSFDAPIAGDEDAETTLHDVVAADENVTPAIEASDIVTRISSLPDRDAQVVRLRFGLDGCQPHELAEIGVVLGITKQRVHVILNRALAALRDQLQEAA
jgi:RNA polymerase sigma factor (sigma-70 family)